MGLCVFLLDIVGVVGSHQRQIVFFRPLDQHFIYPILIGLAVAVEFQIQIGPKNFFPPQERLLRLVQAHVQNFGRYLTIQVSRQHNQSLTVLCNNILIDPGDVIKPMYIGDGRHLNQVFITFFVLGQKHHLIPVVLLVFVFVVFTNL